MHIIKKGDDRADQCFEVLEIVCYPIGGGPQLRIRRDRLEEFEAFDPYAPQHMLWIPGLFIIDIGEHSPALRGFHKRQRWNGFACPVILDEDVLLIQKEWNAANDKDPEGFPIRLEKRDDGYWYMRDSNCLDDPSDAEWDRCQRIEVEFGGEVFECWDIGTYNLCWHDVEHNWVAEKAINGQQLGPEFQGFSTGTCADLDMIHPGMMPVHHPPAIQNCWMRCYCDKCKEAS